MKPGDMVRSSRFIHNSIPIFENYLKENADFVGVIIGPSKKQTQWGMSWVILTTEGNLIDEDEKKIEKLG